MSPDKIKGIGYLPKLTEQFIIPAAAKLSLATKRQIVLAVMLLVQLVGRRPV